MSRSCRDCPSFVPESEADDVYIQSPQADSCYAKGIILSVPRHSDEDNDKTAERFATNCDKYLETRPDSTVNVMLANVGTGDIALMTTSATDPDDKPASCFECSKFVPIDTVADELGWKLGMCAAKGRLLFPKRYVSEAGDCGIGIKGPHQMTTDNVVLHEQYTGGAKVNLDQPVNPFKVDAESLRHAVDPREYVSDRDVTEAEDAAGVRAWRRVNDPEGTERYVMLPIFKGEELHDSDPRGTYGSHRPDLYVDHQGILYDLAVELMALDETPVLIGGAGTGKTEAGCWLAYLMDLPFARLSVSKGTEDWHFKGESKLVNDPETGNPTTVFKPGRFTALYDKPYVIMVDEPNLKNEIYEFLRPAFDSAKQLVIDDDQGLVVDRHDYNFLLVSQNPADDPLYVGTEPMSAADMDRVSPIYFGLPEESVEREIIRRHCADDGYDISARTLDQIMQIAKDIREMIHDGVLPIAWGLRAQVKVSRKTQYYSLEKSYRRAVIDGMEANVVDVITGLVRSVAG